MTTRGLLSVTDFFLVSIKQITDELTALGDPPSDADLIYATPGLGPAYKELITAMRTQDFVVPFEELFDKIIDHETFLLHNEKHNPNPVAPTAHLAKHSSLYHRPQKSHFSSSAPGLLPNPTTANKPYKLNNSSSPTNICQYCDKRGHDAKKCFKLFPQLRF